MINVITQSTAERKAETVALFEACKPYLDRGMSLRKAVHEGTDRKVSNTRNGWFVELKEYAKEHKVGLKVNIYGNMRGIYYGVKMIDKKPQRPYVNITNVVRLAERTKKL